MKIIDMENHPRKTHYEFFKAMAYPYVGMTADVDVTNLVAFAKREKGSTFLACLWAAAHSANAVPEMRQRICGDKVVEYEYCRTGHTVALPNHTFCNCTTDSRMPLKEYLEYAHIAQESAKEQTGFVNQAEEETGMFFASCVPWVSFTQVIQPAPIPADCNPRIIFGKYKKEGEKVLLPVSIQCNHALVDGYHIGLFFAFFAQVNDNLTDGREPTFRLP